MPMSDDRDGPDQKRASDEGRFPPASVVTGCLLGCLLPVIAYAEGMGALFGFGPIRKKWAWLLLIVPTVAWFGFSFSPFTAIFLGGQLLIAAVVSAIIARFVRKSS